ncbi:LRR_1 domain-containing protein/LRR_8 domain-containing protein [Cephalotus follicularis]|uniref:LRR_1 domain-containing protein/LRR_8 domain-containing protein n=1 Tax=Cephalotus follicularis TaxID=3775 RepID=A0A1Q3D9N0_CEPFO|nr:LRR_1 domain-containing protein/LRR_8 domain-containing protein [Cephalotus follicularis]
MVMDEEELMELSKVLADLLEDPDWAQVHPQPCTDTPWPGVECEIGQDPPIFHVTKIHIGPDIITPPCKTTAKLSHSLLKLPYLKTLSLFNCFVASPATLSPTLFGAFASLEHLSLDSNPTLGGEIPPSLAQVDSLRVLSMSQNNLKGHIPSELGGLMNLERLDLSFNNLSGNIPEEIGGLQSLAILDLSFNGLEGVVPCSFGNPQILQMIDLGSNKLFGVIPPELGKLSRLVLLDLSHNHINGPIPETLSGLEQLQYLLIDHNPINSEIPLFVGTLKKLKSISFSGCGLTGIIPNILSLLKNLTALALDNNSLIGAVPPKLGSLPNLDLLNVSHNKLSGQLQLPEKFIDRLAKRLDVRGNGGLCTNSKLNKNSSLYLQTPVCLVSKEVGDNRSPLEQNPGDSKAMQPSGYHGKSSSNAQSLDQKLLSFSCSFVCFFSFLLKH